MRTRSIVLVVASSMMVATSCVPNGTKDTSGTGSGGTSSSSSMTTEAWTVVSSSTGAPDKAWQCVGSVQWPTPEKPQIPLRLTVYHYGSSTDPIAGATVKACPAADEDCALTHPEGVTDDKGQVELMLDEGANGWTGNVQVTGDGLPLNIFAFVKPFTNDSTFDIEAIDQDTLTSLAGIIKAELDPARGHVGIVQRDCQYHLAPNTIVSIDHADANSTTAYFRNGIPKLGTTETDASGAVAIANVLPGEATITSTFVPDSLVFAVTKVPIRAGAVTTLDIEPSPSF